MAKKTGGNKLTYGFRKSSKYGMVSAAIGVLAIIGAPQVMASESKVENNVAINEKVEKTSNIEKPVEKNSGTTAEATAIEKKESVNTEVKPVEKKVSDNAGVSSVEKKENTNNEVVTEEKKASEENNNKPVAKSETGFDSDKDESKKAAINYDHNKTLTDPTTKRQAYEIGKDVPVNFEFSNSTEKDQNVTGSVEVYYGEKKIGSTLQKTVFLKKGEAVKINDESELLKDFTIPANWLEDNKGYRVKVEVKDQDGKVIDYKVMGLAVESDFKKFPRYAAIAGSQDINNSVANDSNVIDKYKKEYEELKNMHINAHFYYDIYKNPTDPLPKDEKIMAQQWNWWTHSTIDQDVLKKMIEQTHKDGAKAFLYNMISARSNFDAPIPVGDNALVYNFEDNFFGKKGTPMRNPMKEEGEGENKKLTVYQEYYNPASPAWQKYIAKVMSDAMDRFKFDGWQGDTIGDSRVTTSENRNTDDVNKSFLMSDTYVNFTNEMKKLIKDKYFTVNAVGGQGLKDLAASDQDMVYAEIWSNGDRDDNKTGTGRYHTEYGDLKRLVDQVRDISGKSLVVAAYMELPEKDNLSKNDKYFQTDAALLVDATVAAAGGYHMTAVANANSKHEHGVGVLDAAYYSSQGLSVSEELNRKLYNYQQFITAYENFLRGDGVTNDAVVASTFNSKGEQISYDDGHDPNKSGIYGNQVWTFTKTSPEFATIQLINLQRINTGWVNRGGTSDNKTPKEEKDLKVVYPLYGYNKEQAQAQAKKVYVASPDDWAKGDMKEVLANVIEVAPEKFALEINVPQLTLWDMIYLPKVANVNRDYKKSGLVSLDKGELLYKDDKGNYARNSFIENNGSWYYADNNGYLVKGRQLINNQDLVFAQDSRQEKGKFVKLDNDKLVYTDINTGEVQKGGFREIEGAWRYLNNDGYVLTGIQKIGNKSYYFTQNGSQVKGQFVKLENGKIIYTNKETGEILKDGFYEIDGSWYYMDKDGYVAVGSKTIDGQELYFREDGRQVKGEWIEVNGKLEYFDKDSGIRKNK